MKKFSLSLIIALISFAGFSQEVEEEGSITSIVDDLRFRWYEHALKLKTYEGLIDYCRVKEFREMTVNMLDEIHHYDSSLYTIVQTKYDYSQDKEAAATLEDIETLEEAYKTRSFQKFLRNECMQRNEIARNAGRAGEDRNSKVVLDLEAELAAYVAEVTRQIDVVDDHIHHLDGFDQKY